MLPSVTRGTSYRTEEVDLKPGGSTVAVTVPSDNPFEESADIEIVTQESGGMAGPDPRMRSRKVVATGGGRKLAPRSRVRHLNAGFLPGMGDGDEVEVGLYGPVRRRPAKPGAKRRPRLFTVRARGFLPGMGGEEEGGGYDQVDGMGAAPAGVSEKDWASVSQFQSAADIRNAELEAQRRAANRATLAAVGKGLLEAGKTTAEVLTAKSASKTASAQAQAEAARARAEEARTRGIMARTGQFASENKGKLAIAGAVVAAAVLAFVLLRKKG